MGETFPHAERSQRAEFIRELVERLYDGCNVTFTLPRHTRNTDLADSAMQGLRARGCLTAYLDLSSINSVDEFADALTQTCLRLMTGDIDSANNGDSVMVNLSDISVEEELRDIVNVADFARMSNYDKIDWAVELSERLAESLDTRLVVWFNSWNKVAEFEGDLLTKRLRALFQYQSHVTYAFVGSDLDLMRMFTDQDQALYRFAVILQFPSE